MLFFASRAVRKLECLTSFPAHLKESEGRRQAGGKITVLLGRPANIPTSLPPLTSGSDQGRHKEREDVSYWLAECSFTGVDSEASHCKDRPHNLIPPTSKTK